MREYLSTDLQDADEPEETSDILRRAAEAYRENAAEWSTPRGTKNPWVLIARILDRAASEIDRNI
jgi:hypothetical protein